MTIYVTYEPKIGNVWGTAINTDILNSEEIAASIDRIKKHAEENGSKAIFQTGSEILGNLLDEIEARRKEVA